MRVRLTTLSLDNLMVLRGKNLLDLVNKMTLSVPTLFRYEKHGQQEFIANLGTSEILINHSSFENSLLEENQYAFQRGDAVFTLSGDWQALMKEVCIYDFRQAKPGDFSMVLVAGVGVWMLIPEANTPLILGCDPTYGHYLKETLQNQINQSPFLNNGKQS